MSLSELLEEVKREYDRVSEFVAGLSQKQLERKAHIPMLKGSPFGEYPTLEAIIEVLGPLHVEFHIGRMREILLGESSTM